MEDISEKESSALKTYLVVFFNSEGARPSQVNHRLENMGFVPIKGYYDFEYEWEKNATVVDALNLADMVHDTLEGMSVYFKLITVEE
ncbi:MAG: hypothetical protein QW728_02280 [Thermoplasmata archaeon]